jgi:glyoxylase-like metal-dependent hydrolase (beta-lactamase superfamily II)
MDAEILAFDPKVGVAEVLEAGVRRVLAPNPSPMTFRGTNTYMVGESGLCVIDPGPDSDAHLEAILGAVGAGQSITHVVVTHAHIDHSPLAFRLAKACCAKVWAFGGPDAGRSDVMKELAARGLAGGGEGVDASFEADMVVAEGDIIEGDGWALEVIHTPGHFGNHIAFGMGDLCFVGDHVMGWASSLVSPPDGDLTDFMESCAKLQARPWRVFHAGHGAPIEEPHARLDWLVKHRLGREAEILSVLQQGADTAAGIAAQIYTETPAALLPAATRNVFAHLVDLSGKNIVLAQGELHADAVFELFS